MVPTDKARADEENRRCIARFAVHFSRFLNHRGEIEHKLPDFAHDSGQLTALYRDMVLTRLFDAKAVALQRTGKMGTYASSLGQEAVAVGIGAAMRPEDILVPTYRECGAQLQRGVTMTEILLYWGGDERGMQFARQAHDFPVCIPIASHVPHAVGVAYALKLRHEARVAVCVLGDGATSKGDFYEALNLAGVWQLPVVFLVSNNQWAISVPRRIQTHAQTLAQKAVAAGIPGEQVDGNDVIAVRHRMSGALEQARQGGGPALIEAVTYRMGDHTTADDAGRYRPAGELAEQERYDPIERLRKYLTQCGAWTSQQEEALQASCSAAVEAAVAAYLDTPPAAPESMFDYLYEKLPGAYEAQRESLRGHTARQGESGDG